MSAAAGNHATRRRPNIYTADPATRLAQPVSSPRHVGSGYSIINVEEAQTGRQHKQRADGHNGYQMMAEEGGGARWGRGRALCSGSHGVPLVA